MLIIVAMPNAASVALHESLGFEPVGVYRNVGYKMASHRPFHRKRYVIFRVRLGGRLR